ncbi:MAG TPA: hypothetical protein VET90_00860, partial [Candidatus Binatus sp.]|nr:hypothetical protein [Candidatus Binatus sp.]
RRSLDRLQELGTRGRAVEGGRTAILAGIAAFEGDAAGALNGFRQSLATLRDLGLRYDEALVTMVAITCLGASDPETQAWAAHAAEFLDEVGARPLAGQLRRLVESGERPAAAPQGAHPRVREQAAEGAG